MASALRITSVNLNGEIVFVTLLQNNITYNIGENVIPFDVYSRLETGKLSGLYTLYVPKYLTNYEIIVPEAVDVTPTNTPTNTVTPSITPTITVTPSITPSNTITPSITTTNTPTNTVTPTQTITPTITATITPSNTITPY